MFNKLLGYQIVEISSRHVAAAIKKRMKPLLLEDGFNLFHGRSAYQFLEGIVVGFSTEACGKYFSDITGFSPMSFSATVWVNYQAIPDPNSWREIKDGTKLPTSMHRHLNLEVLEISVQDRRHVREGAESERKDIWGVSPDGSNLESVVSDLISAYREQVPTWVTTFTDLPQALDAATADRECFNKYEFMYCLAKACGSTEYIAKYESLYFTEMPGFVKKRLESSEST